LNAKPNSILTWRATAWRSRLVLMGLMGAFGAVLVKAFVLQHLNVEEWQRRAENRYERVRDIPAARGRLLDRHGQALAVSIPEYRLGVVRSQIKPQHPRMPELAKLLGLSESALQKKLQANKKYFYLASGLDLEKADRIRQLRMPGLDLEQEFRRHYPYAESFANLIGFTDAEDRGQEGVERAFDDALKGRAGTERVLVDRRNQVVGQRQSRSAAPGEDVRLSVDAGIQSIAHRAVQDAMTRHQAKAAAAVVIDARTGELLAMANAPSFDPNQRQRLDPAHVRNRSVTDSFEPGSTLKPFSIATAMDAGLVRPSSVLPTAAGFMTISGRTIRDTKKLGPLSVSEILEKSSNVGTAQIALRLPAQTLYERYRLSGFGSPVPIQLPGTISGRLRPWQSWVAIDQATMSYGHGISVSLLQLARAYTVFARDGDLAPLSITPVDGPVVGDPVFSSQTTAQMRQMLERATGPEGTAPRSRVQGFRVAGKTGTAHKPERGGYAKNRYISSFAGFVPADAPRVVIAVMVDEPTAGGYFGGEVAAPIFAEIAAESLRRMQMSPDPSIRILPDLLRVAEGAR
jgi:cell division protein FtsI (penicillin-binding protein 3)